MITDALIKAYLKADQFLVDAANFAVKKLNWTTGWTRAEIADVVNVSGQVLWAWATPPLSPINLLNIALFHNIYNLMDENDLRIKNGEAMTRNKERDEKFCRFYTSFCPAGIVYYSQDDVLSGSGMLAFGTTGFIMRADYQAPRKNCIRRGLEKLAEYARNYGAQTNPQPVPITSNMIDVK